MMEAKSDFGSFFAEKRRQLGMSLRSFCRENGFDAGNLSKIERGIFQPPASTEKLTQYAVALQIEEGSDEWYELFDRASAGRGSFPSDIASNEELMEAMPVLFRTIRGIKPSREELQELIATIKKELSG